MEIQIAIQLILAAWFSVSCQDASIAEPVIPSAVRFSVATYGQGTRTFVSEEDGVTCVKWLPTDSIDLYETVGEETQKFTSSSTTLSSDSRRASFGFLLKGQRSGSSYAYTAAYPKAAVSKGGSGSFYRIRIDSVQHLNGNNLAPKSDVLVAGAVTRSARIGDGDELTVEFTRPGTLARLRLKGIQAGERIDSVSLTAPVAVSGFSKVNLLTGEVYDRGYYTDSGHRLKLITNGGRCATGDDTLYFRCLAGTWPSMGKVSVKVWTDDSVYEKTDVQLSRDYVFSEGGFTAIGFNLGTPKPIDPGKDSATTWLDSYEIPSNAALPVTSASLKYEGLYCHSIAQETYGDTKAAIFNLADTTKRIVVHTFSYAGKVQSNFTMLYDKTKRCALWVAMRHNNVDYKDEDVGRHGEWAYDPALPQSWQPYLGSSYPDADYDRGHQIASNDRQTTSEQNKHTFYYSNMTPQYAKLNQGQWQTSVEQPVQTIMATELSGCDSTAVFVVTGPLFNGALTYTLDRNGDSCAVPTGYFKCYMSCGYVSGKLASCKGGAYIVRTNSANVAATSTSIDEVEAETGFDFFPQVPDVFEIPAEK